MTAMKIRPSLVNDSGCFGTASMPFSIPPFVVSKPVDTTRPRGSGCKQLAWEVDWICGKPDNRCIHQSSNALVETSVWQLAWHSCAPAKHPRCKGLALFCRLPVLEVLQSAHHGSGNQRAVAVGLLAVAAACIMLRTPGHLTHRGCFTCQQRLINHSLSL